MIDRIRIAIIDDHPLLRDGVAHTLGNDPGMHVVAVGSCADDAIRIAATLKPDVVLLDISMPGGGIEAARTIAARSPAVKTIMLTVSEREDDVLAAIDAGARGYILKGVTGPDLIGTVKVAPLSRMAFCSASAASRLVGVSALVP